MKFTIPDAGNGLNLDLLASELAPGVWTGSTTNVRFRNGFAEKVGGLLSVTYRSSEVPVWCSVFNEEFGVLDYHIIFASIAKAYSDDSSGVTEITRYTEGQAISSITRVGTTATLTTATNHGRSNGDTVSIWGASPSQYNGTYVIGGVTATTFTYTMASDPGASASPVGLYSYDGAVSDFTNPATSGSGFYQQPYTGGPFNGLFLLNSPADGLYYWNGDLTIPFRKIPLSYKARVSKPFGNYIVQLAPTIDGVEYPRRVVWSSAAEPGTFPASFTSSSTNDAGFVELAASGELVDCLPLGDQLIIYVDDARYAMRYVGGTAVFEFTKLPGTEGLFSRGAVTDSPVGHVFFSNGQQIVAHNGGECRNLSDGRIGEYLRRQVSAYYPAICVLNADKEEVWTIVRTGDSDWPNEIFIWNWKDDVFGRKTLAATTTSPNSPVVAITSAWCARPGKLVPRTRTYITAVTASGTAGYLGSTDTSATDFSGQTVTMILERTGLDCGDRDVIKNLERSRWNFDPGSSATILIEHGSSMTADGTTTYATSQTYTPGTTDYVAARATGGRFLAVKATITDTSSGAPTTKVRSCDLDFTTGGRR